MDMVSLVLRLVFSLAVVLGLLFLISRFAGRRFTRRSRTPIEVLHRQSISRGGAVSVVSVGTRVLVLGTTEHQVNLLSELEPDEIDMPEPGLDEDDDHPTSTPPASRPSASRPSASRPGSAATPSTSPLAGSLLSAQTWKQALSTALKHQSGAPEAPTADAPAAETPAAGGARVDSVLADSVPVDSVLADSESQDFEEPDSGVSNSAEPVSDAPFETTQFAQANLAALKPDPPAWPGPAPRRYPDDAANWRDRLFIQPSYYQNLLERDEAA